MQVNRDGRGFHHLLTPGPRLLDPRQLPALKGLTHVSYRDSTTRRERERERESERERERERDGERERESEREREREKERKREREKERKREREKESKRERASERRERDREIESNVNVTEGSFKPYPNRVRAWCKFRNLRRSLFVVVSVISTVIVIVILLIFDG